MSDVSRERTQQHLSQMERDQNQAEADPALADLIRLCRILREAITLTPTVSLIRFLFQHGAYGVTRKTAEAVNDLLSVAIRLGLVVKPRTGHQSRSPSVLFFPWLFSQALAPSFARASSAGTFPWPGTCPSFPTPRRSGLASSATSSTTVRFASFSSFSSVSHQGCLARVHQVSH